MPGLLMSTGPKLLPLSPQPQGLAWPTETWPEGPLDPRVDHGALEELLDHAFRVPEPEDLGRTHAVVAVQRGKIVAQRYARG